MHNGPISTVDGNMMFHPGLPLGWSVAVLSVMALALVAVLRRPVSAARPAWRLDLTQRPVVGWLMRRLPVSGNVLAVLKLAVLASFLTLVAAGLFGSQIPLRNAATVITWNIWWAGLVFSVLFFGSAWCAVCPWDTLANLLVNRRLTARASRLGSLGLKVPRALRNLWPALILFVGLSWLELGVGVTASPYDTALLALVIVVLAVSSAAIFERRAFCRFFCPVGRTVGFYSQLAPVELRPHDADVCAACTSLECYYGSDHVDPCPTHQVMGRMTQNTFCTSCGNCVRSCPQQNVAWRLRSPSAEAIAEARPHWDEACFMIGLLSLTSFHGLSMMPFWETWTQSLAQSLGGPAALLPAFTLLFAVALTGPVALYAASIGAARSLGGARQSYRREFAQFAFVALPLAFAYHLSHNLNHIAREGVGLARVVANPFGTGTEAMSREEGYFRAMEMLLPQQAVWAIQSGLMVLGFLIATKVILHRSSGPARASAPLVGFAVIMTGFHLWILMQPMSMRF